MGNPAFLDLLSWGLPHPIVELLGLGILERRNTISVWKFQEGY